MIKQIIQMIGEARRFNGKTPDYIVLGREDVVQVLSADIELVRRYVDRSNRDEFKIMGIDVVESAKEHELSVCYTYAKPMFNNCQVKKYGPRCLPTGGMEYERSKHP